jgi:HK97 family phage major capsid protein
MDLIQIKAAVESSNEAIERWKNRETARIDEIKAIVTDLAAKSNRPRLFGEDRAAVNALGPALRKALRGDDAELKQMSASTDPAGGFLVLPFLERSITSIREAVSPLSAAARTITLDGGGAAELPIIRGDLPGAWVGELQARPATATIPVEMARIELTECYCNPSVTQRILDDSQYDVGALLVEQIGHGLALLEDIALHAGSGTGQPRGMLTYPTAATGDATRAWGQLQHVNTGANGAFHTTGADALFEAVGALHSRYRPNAKWMMSRGTHAAVRKLKAAADGHYLLQPSIAGGAPDTLLGHPVIISEQMPAHTGTGALAIALGDFAQAVTVVRRPGIRLIVDPYSVKGQVSYYAHHRVGGAVVDFNAVKFVRFAA